MTQHRRESRSPWRRLRPGPWALGVATVAFALVGVADSPAAEDVALASSARTTPWVADLVGAPAGTEPGARAATVSRGTGRQGLGSAAAERRLVAAAERQARRREATLAGLARQAEKRAARLARERWVLPIASYRLTAGFGDHGLWASSHTGLDFAAPSGAAIRAVAGGRVVATGYDGPYGNKTVVRLADGTEVWYCHQTTIDVSRGERVLPGQRIGTVGSTGHSTGPHLHLEVRPGGDDPVDPAAALREHGLRP